MMAAGEVWVSLGCDLGTHKRKKRTRMWHYAGGYIQFISSNIDAESDYYQEVAEQIYFRLLEEARNADWRIILEITKVCYKPDGAEHDIDSLWVWFDVGALTLERAEASRERLLEVLHTAIESAPAPA